jgi:hypothetical protein
MKTPAVALVISAAFLSRPATCGYGVAHRSAAAALQPRHNPTAGAVVLIDSFSEPESS